MTISASEPLRAGPYYGDGATVQFDFEFTVFNESDLLVLRQDADGNYTVLELTTDYTVTFNGVSVGGHITLVDAALMPSGAALTIIPDVALEQPYPFRNQGALNLGYFEDALDSFTVVLRGVLAVTQSPEVLGAVAALAQAAETFATEASGSAATATTKATEAAASAAALTYADKAEAEAGTASNRVMSPIRTAQAMATREQIVQRTHKIYDSGDISSTTTTPYGAAGPLVLYSPLEENSELIVNVRGYWAATPAGDDVAFQARLHYYDDVDYLPVVGTGSAGYHVDRLTSSGDSPVERQGMFDLYGVLTQAQRRSGGLFTVRIYFSNPYAGSATILNGALFRFEEILRAS